MDELKLEILKALQELQNNLIDKKNLSEDEMELLLLASLFEEGIPWK